MPEGLQYQLLHEASHKRAAMEDETSGMQFAFVELNIFPGRHMPHHKRNVYILIHLRSSTIDEF
jgi:hypothetical protein